MARSKARYANLTSWSFSTYAQYLHCPFSVCLDKIIRVRIQEPENPAFLKGNRSHEIADGFVSGARPTPSLTATIPHPDRGQPAIRVDMTPVRDVMTRFKKAKAKTEQEWAFTRDWVPCDWRDWDRAWVRIKTDVCADTVEPPHVDIVDWKTGKVHPEDHRLQRRLYATGGLQLVQAGVLAGGDRAADCTAQHVYVDTGQTATETFKMKELAGLKREWVARVKPMLADTTFRTKTGPHCRWCKYRKSAGGPCPENR
jgi:PD-(D/E)XK nuclease superfamily